ncbi:hypothetical protein [Kineococcus sp. R86509]|uniref:hypothetical protein n=1 Tax=Kineococcus sp. R86509 TaxID=3093851 RepID=UPI0036D32EAA
MTVVQSPGADNAVIRGKGGAHVVVAVSDGLPPGAAGVLDEYVEAGTPARIADYEGILFDVVHRPQGAS